MRWFFYLFRISINLSCFLKAPRSSEIYRSTFLISLWSCSCCLSPDFSLAPMIFPWPCPPVSFSLSISSCMRFNLEKRGGGSYQIFEQLFDDYFMSFLFNSCPFFLISFLTLSICVSIAFPAFYSLFFRVMHWDVWDFVCSIFVVSIYSWVAYDSLSSSNDFPYSLSWERMLSLAFSWSSSDSISPNNPSLRMRCTRIVFSFEQRSVNY